MSRNGSSSAAGAMTADRQVSDLFPLEPGTSQQPGAGQAPRPASRRALKNWRVRSRLLLLVVIPTVTAVAAGGAFIASSVQSASVDQRVLTLANLSGKVTGLVQSLQNERQDTIEYIVLGNAHGGRGAPLSAASPENGLLQLDYATSTGWANQVKALADDVDGSYSPLAQQDAQATITAINDLPAIRSASTTTQLPPLIVIGEYATAINTLLAVESQIAVGSSDSTLAGSVRVLGLVSSMKEEASQQQALLTSALSDDLVSLGTFGPDQKAAITDAQAQQQGDLNEFDTAATSDQRQLFSSVLSGSSVVGAQAQEQQAISLAASGSPIATDPTISDASSSLTYVVAGMRSAEQQFANAVISRSASLRNGAITSAILFSLAVALLLAVALIATTVVGHSMVGPLRRLRNGALEVAGSRLPDTVRRMSEADGGENVRLEIEPIDVDSSDEIGEVARAFDQVHKEAVRLAADEAALRGNVNAMFVNLSRRSQSLVERQIRVITRLEHGEQDSERLASLFHVDHLATRMRRNSENLLVLAGQELSRRWSRPVALVDVLRAAVSEIEQYDRVTLNVQPGISIRKEAVSDVVHLTAELVENATSYSAAETPVTIAAHLLSTGGALVEITDQGVGIPAEQLAHANWRLDNPPTVDVAVSRRMGLFVVARLAARHGIRVRLRPAPTAGLSALIWLPNETITKEDGGQTGPRPVQATQGARTVTPMPTRPATGTGRNGHIAPLREVSRDAGPAPQVPMPQVPMPQVPMPQVPLSQAPLRENLEPTAPAQYPPADAPVQDGESWAAPGSYPRISRGYLHAAGLTGRPWPQGGDTGQSGETGQGATAQNSFGQNSPAQNNPALGGAQSGSALGGADPRDGRLSAAVGAGIPAAAGTGPRPVANGAPGHEYLPIFEAVESDWFRRGRQIADAPEQGPKAWSSPADAGWRAASVVQAPASDGLTVAGLPKRAPGVNLVPGTAAAQKASGTATAAPATGTSPQPAPARSAAEMRERLAGFQRGIREGRAAAAGGNHDSGNGTAS